MGLLPVPTAVVDSCDWLKVDDVLSGISSSGPSVEETWSLVVPPKILLMKSLRAWLREEVTNSDVVDSAGSS